MTDRHPDGTPKLKPTMCVECGYVMDAAGPAGSSVDAPTPGCVALCLNCGHLSMIDDLLRLREPTAEEWLDPELHDLQRLGRLAATHHRDNPFKRPN
jgi:hypothetical protein